MLAPGKRVRDRRRIRLPSGLLAFAGGAKEGVHCRDGCSGLQAEGDAAAWHGVIRYSLVAAVWVAEIDFSNLGLRKKLPHALTLRLAD